MQIRTSVHLAKEVLVEAYVSFEWTVVDQALHLRPSAPQESTSQEMRFPVASRNEPGGFL